MSYYDSQPFYGGTDGTHPSNVRQMRETSEAVFSKTGGYNPTSLAVAKSLQEIFDECHPMIAGNLRMLHTTDDETV